MNRRGETSWGRIDLKLVDKVESSDIGSRNVPVDLQDVPDG
jgi:hypothetical protein